MGVLGLSSYLQSNSNNFIPYELSGTPIVVDASNFVHYLYFHRSILTQFGGEYLEFAYSLLKVIHQFEQCEIKPYFVFDGCHKVSKLPTQLSRAKQRLQTSRLIARQAATNNLDATDLNQPILPLLAVSALSQLLQLVEHHCHYVTAEREADADIASLASYLTCPLISNDSDFFITIDETDDESNLCFLPLDQIPSFKPIARQSSYFIRTSRFNPKGPGLGQLNKVQKPLFASLIGNDIISPCQLAQALPTGQRMDRRRLTSSVSSSARSTRKRRLYKTLIAWLAGFEQDSEQPINRLLSRLPSARRDRNRALLTESMASYQLDISRIGAILDSTISAPPLPLEDPQLQSLPQGLVKRFRQYKINPSLLDPLACDASVLPSLVECLDDHKSIHACSQPIRRLIYALLLAQLDSNPYDIQSTVRLVTEYYRSQAGNIKPHRLQVLPLRVVGKASNVDFIQRHVASGYQHHQGHPRWLSNLALIATYWFKVEQRPGPDPQCDPILLAFVSIALSSCLAHYSQPRSKAIKTILAHIKMCKNHYINCCHTFTKKQQAKKKSKTLDLAVVHSNNQLQSIYLAFDTLHWISIDSSQSDDLEATDCIDELPPIWILFPSGHLFHSLVGYIHQLPQDQRLDYAKKEFLSILTIAGQSKSESMFDQLIQQIDCLATGNFPILARLPEDDDQVAVPSVPRKPPRRTTKHKKQCARRRSIAEMMAEVDRLMQANGLSDF